MLHSSLSRKASCIHSCCMRENESKILSSKPLSRTTGLPRNRSWQKTPKLYRTTLFFTNKDAILYSNEQSSDNSRQSQQLEDNPFWARKQRQRRHKNKQRNQKQLKQKTNNCISTICSNIEGIGLLRPWNILQEKREKMQTLYSYFVNFNQSPLSPIPSISFSPLTRLFLD